MEEDDNVDSLNGHTEEDKIPAETNRKRKLKTPAQLQALEEYYEDHKYPTESLKAEIAEKLGLTEKQVSGWFCHRRLKDKRLSREYGNGRMDRYSGVIQEHCSEPAQDSCGSTKPGGYYKHGELKEVESQSQAGQEFSLMNLVRHDRMNTARLDVDMNETSSESSSPLHPIHLPQREVPQTWENGDALPLNSKVVIDTQFRRPSGYLKIKQKAEHPAISAVKRQLGKNFREDGPPLGIEFHPLPIDAFREPKVTNQGPSTGTDSLLLNTAGHSYLDAHSTLEMLNGTFRPDDSDLEEQVPEVNHRSEVFYSQCQLRPKSSVPNKTKLHSEWEPSSNMGRDYAEETYISKRDFSSGAKYGSKGLHIQPNSSDHFIPSTDTLTTEQSGVSLHNPRHVNPKISPRGKHLKDKLSNSKHRQREPHDTFERGPYTREPEVEKLCTVSAATPDYDLMEERLHASKSDPIEYPSPPVESIYVDNNLKDKEVQLGYPQPDLAKKALLPTNLDRRAAGEISSSFSKDEPEETGSSADGVVSFRPARLALLFSTKQDGFIYP